MAPRTGCRGWIVVEANGGMSEALALAARQHQLRGQRRRLPCPPPTPLIALPASLR